MFPFAALIVRALYLPSCGAGGSSIPKLPPNCDSRRLNYRRVHP